MKTKFYVIWKLVSFTCPGAALFRGVHMAHGACGHYDRRCLLIHVCERREGGKTMYGGGIDRELEGE